MGGTMNRLPSAYIVKYSLSPFRFAKCCRNITTKYLNIEQTTGNLSAEWLTRGSQFSNIRWIQLRLRCDKPPKYVRDMEFPDFDGYRKSITKDSEMSTKDKNEQKQGYSYLIGLMGFMGASYAAKTIAVDFVSYMSASADILAMAKIEVDLAKIAPGACVSYKWRGKPLFVKHRTEDDIEVENKTPLASLKDPQSPEDRTKKQEWLIVIGICTHLGCVPIPNTGDFPGGFYCPCHGSHYDNVGRARKGPAPLNLEVPPYVFLGDDKVLVG